MQKKTKYSNIKYVKSLALMLVLTVTAFFGIRFLPHGFAAYTFKNSVLTPTVVIDAGHGGLTNTIN